MESASDPVLATVLIGMVAACTADGSLEPTPEVVPAHVTVEPPAAEVVVELSLNPGASISPPHLRARFAPASVPGDSLADGTYHLAARVDVGLDSHHATRYRLPLGTLRVERP